MFSLTLAPLNYQRVEAGLALDHVAAVAGVPDERVVVVPRAPCRCRDADDDVVAVAADEQVVAVAAGDRVVARAAVEREL